MNSDPNVAAGRDALARQVAALREACREVLREIRVWNTEPYYGGSPERIEKVLSAVLEGSTPGELRAEAIEKQLRAAYRVTGYAGHTAQCAARTSKGVCTCGYEDALKAYRETQRDFPI